MHGVGTLTFTARKWIEHGFLSFCDLSVVNVGGWRFVRILCRAQAGPAAEYQQIGERIPAQPVRAVESRSSFACCEQTGQGSLCSFGFNVNTAHHVMAGWTNFHRLLGDVHVPKFFELVIHAWKLLFYVLGRFV